MGPMLEIYEGWNYELYYFKLLQLSQQEHLLLGLLCSVAYVDDIHDNIYKKKTE